MKCIDLFRCCKSVSTTRNSEVETTPNMNNRPVLKEPKSEAEENEPLVISATQNVIISKIEPSRNKKDSSISFSNIRIQEQEQSVKLFDTEILNSHELHLTGEIFWNKNIMIDRFGLKLNKRKNKSSIASFGVTQRYNEKGEPLIDFLLNFDSINKPNIHTNETIFLINFDKESDSFKFTVTSKNIKILNVVDYNYYFQDNLTQFLLFGSILAEVCSINDICNNAVENGNEDTNVNSSKLSIKVNVDDKWEEYLFDRSDMPVTIGRKNSSINIKNTSISKNHCIINYDSRYQLFFLKDLGSTNGTYLQMTEGTVIEINGTMNFKIFDSNFTINEVD